MFVKENKYDYLNRFKSSTKFLLANGYYGYRGTLSEDSAEDMVAWNLNGIYDQVADNWRESINAFNPLYTYIKYQKKILHPKQIDYLSHYLSLNLETGVLTRKTIFLIEKVEITIISKRFADQDDLNLIHEEYSFTSNQKIDIDLYQGIDMDIYNISGKHLGNIKHKSENDILHVSGISQEKNIFVDVLSIVNKNFASKDKIIVENNKLLHHYKLELKPSKKYTLTISAGVIHSKDDQSEELLKKLNLIRDDSFNGILERTKSFWKEKWLKAKVELIGSTKANLALNYDIFQLIAHRPYNNEVSIPARGLSGQVYKGAVFWDTEIYMFLFYLLTDKVSARRILEYRINGLAQAIVKAENYGYNGAFYAWESQKKGFDACSDYNLTDPITKEPIRTYFKELQIHINSAIIYALNQYLEKTKDYDILFDGGYRMLTEINRFYFDYLKVNEKGNFECLNVIGPDEYHEHVNNNAYTNYMIKFCFDKQFEYLNIIKEKNKDFYTEFIKADYKILEKLELARKNLVLPKPNVEGIIPQFDGYLNLKDIPIKELLKKKKSENEYLGGTNGLATNTQILKQADVILLIVLFPKLFPKKIQEINYNYYKTRTEHGSSLSKAVYSILASRLGYKEETFDFFLGGANIDIAGTSKQYAGGIYIGGSHLAAYGGAYMAVVLGFLGYDFSNKSFNYNFPKEIKNIKYYFN